MTSQLAAAALSLLAGLLLAAPAMACIPYADDPRAPVKEPTPDEINLFSRNILKHAYALAEVVVTDVDRMKGTARIRVERVRWGPVKVGREWSVRLGPGSCGPFVPLTPRGVMLLHNDAPTLLSSFLDDRYVRSLVRQGLIKP